MATKYPLFSNGTEFMLWQARNCERCVKAVFFDERKNFCPKYRCAVQAHIEEAAITDGCGNRRDYEVTHATICPYRKTERTRRVRRAKKDNSLTINFE